MQGLPPRSHESCDSGVIVMIDVNLTALSSSPLSPIPSTSPFQLAVAGITIPSNAQSVS